MITDDLSHVAGKHTIQAGGSLTRLQDNIAIVGLGSFLQFLSWPDFLLGLNATQNGTNLFSNVYASVDDYGLLNREYRAWEGSAYAQDNYRVTPTLTLSFGLRYERLGQFGDQLGRNSSFDMSKADPNPPPQGSTAGYIVASNFAGTTPPGVIRADNTFANNAEGQNTLAPRIGFAWQFLPNVSQLLLRGGYGMYYSRPTGQAFFAERSRCTLFICKRQHRADQCNGHVSGTVSPAVSDARIVSAFSRVFSLQRHHRIHRLTGFPPGTHSAVRLERAI